MDKKKISVLMTVYKENEEELRESFESIINQTYKNLEIIVVIDFPDETWRKELIEQYKDTRVKLILNEKNIKSYIKDTLEKYKERFNSPKILFVIINQSLTIKTCQQKIDLINKNNVQFIDTIPIYLENYFK